MNLTQLTTFTANNVSDPGQTRYAGLYTDTINKAQQQFALDTRCLFKDQAYSVTAGTSTSPYTAALPSDFFEEKKVTLNGLKLDPITRADLEFYKRSSRWDQDTGTPLYFLIDPEEARKTMLLFPIPGGSDAGTSNLILTYHATPTDLVSATDIPLNGSTYLIPYHMAISYYAAYMLMGFEPATEQVTLDRSEVYKEYQNKVTECIDRFGNTKSAPIRLKGGRSWR